MKKIISRTINLAFLLMLSGCFAGTKQDFAGIPSSQNEQNQQEKSLEQTTVSTKNSTGKYGTADAIADLQKMGEGDSIFMHSTRRGKIYHHKHYFLSYSERDEQAALYIEHETWYASSASAVLFFTEKLSPTNEVQRELGRAWIRYEEKYQ